MKKKVFKRILLGIIISLSILFFLECVQRIRYYYRYKDTSWLKYGFYKIEDKFQEGEQTYEGITYTINSQQIRGKEFLAAKAENTIRVIAVGDSITFGVSNPDEYTYPWLMNEAFAKMPNIPVNVEVINAGQQGSSSDDCVYWIKEKVLSLQPDLLIVMVGWNDIIKGLYEGRPKTNTVLQYLTLKSVLVLTVREKVSAVKGNIDKAYWEEVYYRPPEKVFQRYEKNLFEIAAIAKTNKINIFLMKFPYGEISTQDDKEFSRTVQQYKNQEMKEDYKRIHDIMDKVGSDMSIKVLDVARFFSQSGEQNKLFFDDGIHLSNYGNKILAQLVIDFIIENQFIE